MNFHISQLIPIGVVGILFITPLIPRPPWVATIFDFKPLAVAGFPTDEPAAGCTRWTRWSNQCRDLASGCQWNFALRCWMNCASPFKMDSPIFWFCWRHLSSRKPEFLISSSSLMGEILSVPAPNARLIACPISPQLLKKFWRSQLFWHSSLAVLAKTFVKESATPNFSEIRYFIVWTSRSSGGKLAWEWFGVARTRLFDEL